MGGGNRLDIRINLIALGSTPKFECPCHRKAEAKIISRDDLLIVVGLREGMAPEDIEAEIWRLQRAPKGIGKCP